MKSDQLSVRYHLLTLPAGVGADEAERFLLVFPPPIFLPLEFLRDLSSRLLDEFQLWESACAPRPVITALPNTSYQWYHHSAARFQSIHDSSTWFSMSTITEAVSARVLIILRHHKTQVIGRFPPVQASGVGAAAYIIDMGEASRPLVVGCL